ncbi:MAG: hypothetical protein HYS27_01215 [Deltaproteobacteria bacterium]|nr:hypothetical protein [Deltaproteobacteria bacterium]
MKGAAVVDAPAGPLAALRAGSLQRSHGAGRLARVAWGAAVVGGLARVLWREPALRRRYLWVLGIQLAVVLAAAVGWLAFDGDLHRVTSSWRRFARFALTLYATVVVTQWIVIAISRQFHDEISMRLARAAGVEPDEIVERPRLSLDLGWVFEGFQRRVQAALVLAVSAAPAVLLLGAIVLGPSRWLARHDDGALRAVALAAQWALAQLPNAALLAISLYWLAVLTIGRTGHAWRDGGAPAWAPLRWVEAGSARHPALYGPARLWVRAIARPMGLLHRPAAVVARAPWEAIGLALVQLSTNLPGVRLLLRPLVPVAATVVMVATQAPATGTEPSPGIAGGQP